MFMLRKWYYNILSYFLNLNRLKIIPDSVYMVKSMNVLRNEVDDPIIF